MSFRISTSFAFGEQPQQSINLRDELSQLQFDYSIGDAEIDSLKQALQTLDSEQLIEFASRSFNLLWRTHYRDSTPFTSQPQTPRMGDSVNLEPMPSISLTRAEWNSNVQRVSQDIPVIHSDSEPPSPRVAPKDAPQVTAPPKREGTLAKRRSVAVSFRTSIDSTDSTGSKEAILEPVGRKYSRLVLPGDRKDSHSFGPRKESMVDHLQRPGASFMSRRMNRLDSCISVASVSRGPMIESGQLLKGVDEEGFKTINDYTLLSELGRGMHGKVKLVCHNETGEMRAMKIVKRSRLSALLQEGGGGDIAREVAVMKKLRHKHIVNLYEVIDDADHKKIYLVMDYVEHGPLLKLSDDGTCAPLPTGTVRRYFRQITAGLMYLHRHGVAHLDIKPDNILLGKEDCVYLADFGVSQFMDSGSVSGSRGTPSFFAPELFTDTTVQDGAAIDVWALGVTLYLMMFGKLPFNGTTHEEMERAVTQDALVIPDTCSDDWAEMLTQMLEKDSSKRIGLSQVRRHPLVRGLRGNLLGDQSPLDSGVDLRDGAGSPNGDSSANNSFASPIQVTDADMQQALTQRRESRIPLSFIQHKNGSFSKDTEGTPTVPKGHGFGISTKSDSDGCATPPMGTASPRTRIITFKDPNSGMTAQA